MTTRFRIALLVLAALGVALVGKFCNGLMYDLTTLRVFGVDIDFDDA